MQLEMSETALAEGFRARDQAAATVVMRAHRARLVALSRRMGCDAQQAEDAVQEALAKAWRNAPSYDPGRPIGAWLNTITRCTVIDKHRKARRSVATTPLDTHAIEADDRAMRDLDGALYRSPVRRAVASLPPRERAVVWHAYFEDVSHREIGERLGIAEGTVKSRMFRAHQRLASLLTDFADGAAA